MKSKPATEKVQGEEKSSFQTWLIRISWGASVFMLVLMTALVIYRAPVVFSAFYPEDNPEPMPEITEASIPVAGDAGLPDFSPEVQMISVNRDTNTHTIIPSKARTEPTTYTVQKGDSLFGIASKYDLKPESVLWANYATLNDDPHSISVGQDLVIPPIDGILYTWKEGDTIEQVASEFEANPSDILNWSGNKLDITNPVVETETEIMIPDGWREFQQWVVETYWRPNAGASQTIAGPGGCTISGGGAYGTGYFVWPAVNHFLSGNDYWSGHLGIDIAAGEGAAIYAADSGVVVYAGPIGGGYGNMIMIDHGNGYHSLYAHLSVVSVYCGQSVYQGNVIGLAGSTGNSTGAHLHFEIRLNGGFINPWYVLP